MKTTKNRSILCAGALKVFSVLLILISVAVCSGSVGMLLMLRDNGMDLNELWTNEQKSYESTWKCGNDIVNYMNYLSMEVNNGNLFMDQGKMNADKLVDIAGSEEERKNENTTYTVENIRDMAEDLGEFSELIYMAENGYYEYLSAEEESPGAGEKGEGEYSPQFLYLYEYGKNLENRHALPQSGISLADYAKDHRETVSLLDLYKALVDILERMDTYQYAREQMSTPTNLLYYVENTETGEIYTNVDDWKDGYQELEIYEKYKEQLFFQGTRTDGILEADVENHAEDFLKNHFQSSSLVGDQETMIFLINTDYPVDDYIARSAAFYEKYINWGRILLMTAAVSIVLGLCGFVLLHLQTGRCRADRDLHLKKMDRLPTEVVLVIAGVAFLTMAGTGISVSLGDGTGYWQNVLALVVLEPVCCGIFLWFYTSLIRRVKGKLLWKNSLVRNILVSCGKVYAARKTSGRMITAFVFLMVGNMFVLLAFRGFGLFLALMGDGVVLLYLLKEGAGRQVIRDGLGRIAGGELDFKIDERELTGDNREMAEAVNHVGDGLQKAVKETLKSERLKADLITNVSHDIKTPLTSIINYVDLLKREDIQDPRIKGYIDVLDQKSQRLKQLTEDLVEASKISSGNVTLDVHPILLGELIWQTNGEFEEKFAARGLEIVCRIPEDPVRIFADGRRMWRVVENLYNNVAKYAMPNTRVYVEVKKIGCRVVFQVKNIAENSLHTMDAEQLTERFIRGDVSRSTEGSGLGLSIAKNLVTLQKGTFDIYLDGDLFKVVITFQAVESE